MEKSLFYDINYGDDQRDSMAKAVKNIDMIDLPASASDATISSEAPRPYTQGENIMAEVDTAMLAGQHADIRREAAEHASDIRFNVAERAGDIRREGAEHTNEIVREGLKESFNIRGDVKDTRHDVINEVDRQGDRVTNQAAQFYIAGQQNATEAARDLASLRTLTEANATAMRSEIALNVEKTAAASALAAEKIASAVALGQSMLSKEIFHDGQKTRDLINDLKYHDLNRGLVERNTALVAAEDNHRHYRDRWMDGRFDQNQAQFAGQWAQLQSQIQAFQSQLQETRQGMVNFGTMAGNAGQQTSTSNNVR
jgi:hypothetical protein